MGMDEAVNFVNDKRDHFKEGLFVTDDIVNSIEFTESPAVKKCLMGCEMSKNEILKLGGTVFGKVLEEEEKWKEERDNGSEKEEKEDNNNENDDNESKEIEEEKKKKKKKKGKRTLKLNVPSAMNKSTVFKIASILLYLVTIVIIINVNMFSFFIFHFHFSFLLL